MTLECVGSGGFDEAEAAARSRTT